MLKLKKAEVNQWEHLDDVEKKRKEDRQQRIDHGDLKGATTEQLLKDMYDNADEEGKRGLREAMAAVTTTGEGMAVRLTPCVASRVRLSDGDRRNWDI